MRPDPEDRELRQRLEAWSVGANALALGEEPGELHGKGCLKLESIALGRFVPGMAYKMRLLL